MSMFNRQHLGEEINRRRVSSNIKNTTDELTFADSNTENGRNAKAYHITSIRKHNNELKRLVSEEDYKEDYYDNLLD